MIYILYLIRDFIDFVLSKVNTSIDELRMIYDNIGRVKTAIQYIENNNTSFMWFTIPLLIILGLVIIFRIYSLLPIIGSGSGE